MFKAKIFLNKNPKYDINIERMIKTKMFKIKGVPHKH